MKMFPIPLKTIGASLVATGLFFLTQTSLEGQSATGWTGAIDGYWNNAGNWTNGIPNSGSPAARILNFGPLGSAQPNSTNDMPGAAPFGVSSHRIFFNAGAPSFTLYLKPGTNGPTLNDFGVNQPQIQNDSSVVQTIDMSFQMQAKGIAIAANQVGNINPTAGDLVFTTNCTVTLYTNTHLKFFSTAGRSVTFYGPLVNAPGLLNACQLATTGSGGKGPTVIFYNTNACTNIFINCGTLRLATNRVTGFPILIGDTNAANAPPAFLQLDNGLTNNSLLVIQTLQPSGTNSRTIANTAVGSGPAVFSGPISLGTNLTTSADPAGTLMFTGDLDYQNTSGQGRTILVSGAGDTIFSGSLTNASTGSSVVTKTNSGTLTLSGPNNASRILYNIGGGVVSITNGSAIGIPTGVNYPDKVNFTADATLRVTNSFTLGRNVSGSDNAGFRIKGGNTGTFDVAATSTLTVDGPIIDIPATTAGNLAKSGAGVLALQQANSYSGSTFVNSGTLSLVGSGAISSSTNINVAASATLDASGRSDATLTLGASQTLMGNGTVIGTVAASGKIAPGASIGTLTLNNSPTLNGTVVMEINSTNGQTSDKLIVSANPLTYGGTLIVTNLGPDLAGGEVFDLFDASSFGGTFASVTLPTLPVVVPALNWFTDSLTSNGTIAVNRAPTPGAATLNTVVNEAATVTAAKLVSLATDADGNTLTVTGALYSGGNGSSVNLAGGIVTYTPGPGFVGSESFSYTLSDGHGGTAGGTVSVTVAPSSEGFNRVSIETLGNGDVKLSYAGIPGYNYSLDWTHDLSAPIVWTPIVTNQAGANGALAFTNTPSMPGPDFYRTRYVP
jgi:autotransporter-associated beta strand protein